MLEPYFYAQRIGEARLLSPSQAKDEAHEMHQRPDLPGYFLYLALTNAHVVRMEQTSKSGIRFPVYPLPCGVTLVVPTIQAGDLQVRVMVPLVNEKSQSWARECVAAERIQWLFEIAETRQAAVVTSGRSFPRPQDALVLIDKSRVRVPVAELVHDMTAMLSVLQKDEGLDSCVEGVVVKDVRVGVVDEFSTANYLASALRQPRSALSKNRLH